jgi:cation transport ATPase
MSILLLSLIAAVVTLIFGAVWHMPLFGKKWGQALGMTMPANPNMKPMYVRMAINLVMSYITAFTTFLFLYNFRAGTFGQIMVTLAVIFVGFNLTQVVVTNLWNGRPTKDALILFGISASYQLINLFIWGLLFMWLAL